MFETLPKYILYSACTVYSIAVGQLVQYEK